MVVIDGFLDLVIDYNLILFIPDVQENAPIVTAFSFPHEVFAILNSSEEDAESRTEMGKGLHK